MKFEFNWPSGFRGEDVWKCCRTDGRRSHWYTNSSPWSLRLRWARNKTNFKNTTGVPTSLDPDQAQCLVGPDLGSNCFKGCQQTTCYRQQRNLSSQGRYIEMVQAKSISTLMDSDCYKEGYLSLSFSNLHIACSAQTVCESLKCFKSIKWPFFLLLFVFVCSTW